MQLWENPCGHRRGRGGGTHHSQVVIHWLEGAAQQLTGLWISDLPDASSVLRVPDAEGPVQRRRHNDVVAQGPRKVRDGAAVTFQGHLDSGRRRGERHDRQGAVQRAAGQQVLVIVGKLQPRNWGSRRECQIWASTSCTQQVGCILQCRGHLWLIKLLNQARQTWRNYIRRKLFF